MDTALIILFCALMISVSFAIGLWSKKKANTMTVSWGGVGVLWGKNVAFIFIRDSRYTKEIIDAQEFFSISFIKITTPFCRLTEQCGNFAGAYSDF